MLLALLSAMVLPSTVVGLPPSVEVGRAQVDVTPAESLPLGGYTERQGKNAQPGGDRLYARAIAFRQGTERIVVVSLETLTIPESLVARVRSLIPKDVKLFLAATHTHCAPDSQMMNDRMTFTVPGIATYRRRYLDEMGRKIAAASTAALRAVPERGGLWFLGAGHLARNHSRRTPDQVDRYLGSLRLGGEALLWCYAAHPVFYDSDELKTRGDWPGALTGSTGGLTLLGPIGDASPDMDKRPAAEQIADFVTSIRSAVATPLALGPPVLGWAGEKIDLAKPTPHPGFAKTYRVPEPLAALAVAKFAPSEASISAFRIGKLAVVGVPGEPTGDLGRRISDAGRRIGFSAVWVTSHVNGWMGYILEPADYDRGGYEATLAMHGREAGDRVVEAAVRALEKLARRRG